MSGSTSFRFKKPINWAYAPGLTKAGADGSVGNPGKDGNAVYFIDYELNNSYNIELAQQKLENNFTLSGNSVQISENRTYHSGDLIITSSGNCYRIEKGGDQYYTFSIHYIGRISYNRSNYENKVKALMVCIINDPADGFDSKYNGFVPNNRQYLEETSGSHGNIYKIKYNRNSTLTTADIDNVFCINGIWCKFFVITEEPHNQNEKYSVEIRFNNSKTYQFNSVSDLSYSNNDPTGSPLSGVFKFKKTLEFPSPNLTSDEFTELLSESVPDIANYADSSAYFLSDMSMDKVHLFNNDIKPIATVQNDKTYLSLDGVTRMKAVDSSEQICRRSKPGFSWPDGNTADVPVPAVYSKYDGDSSIHSYNWRGGESAYFSSYEKVDIAKLMTEFMHKADFRIVQHNITNSTVKFIEVTPEFIKIPNE